MTGKIHVPRFLFFMMMRQGRRRKPDPNFEQRQAQVEAAMRSPKVIQFFAKLREAQHDREMAIARRGIGRSRVAPDLLSTGVLVQPQGNRPDPDRVQPPAVRRSEPVPVERKPGWFFYADGVLHQGFPTWEACLAALEKAAERGSKDISEVEHYE